MRTILATILLGLGTVYVGQEKQNENEQPAPRFAVDPDRESVAWQMLDRRAGEWHERVTIKPSGRKTEFTQTAKWVLNERFLEMRSTGERGYLSVILLGYDANRNTVRMWYYNSAGQFSDWLGRVDTSGNKVEWTTDLGGGVSGKATWDFTDNDLLKWTSIYYDPDGKAIEQLDGTNQRLKSAASQP